jgi:hypothetical protein
MESAIKFHLVEVAELTGKKHGVIRRAAFQKPTSTLS